MRERDTSVKSPIRNHSTIRENGRYRVGDTQTVTVTVTETVTVTATETINDIYLIDTE